MKFKNNLLVQADFSASKVLNLLGSPTKLREIGLFIISGLLILIIFYFFLNKLFLLSLFLILSILLAWHNIRLSIFLLIVSLFISPKINLIYISSESVFVRFDDLLLLGIFFITLAKLKINDFTWLNSPLNKPIFFFIIILIISIIKGIFIRTITNPITSFFYLLKIIEYFCIFYLVYFYTRKRKDLIYYLNACFLGLVIIGGYGIYEHFHPLARLPYPALYRIYERGFFYGQSNHLGGTLAFFISLMLGLTIFINNWRTRVPLMGLVLISVYPFFWTYSRQAQLNLIASLFVLGFFNLKYAKRYFKFIFILIVLILSVLVLSSPLIRERMASIKEVVLSNDIYSSSFAYRIYKWKQALSDTKDNFILGTGLGSRQRAFYEGQWIMWLAETGILGTLIFLGLIFKVFTLLFVTFRHTNDNFYRGLAGGCLAGLAGLMVQSFVCNVFTITVIIGPFYVILALILASARKLMLGRLWA
jgi:hypothetical protein